MITVIVIFMLLIHFVLAVSVFADAKARNMNAVVWAVIVFIGICFVGLIIYAIVREPIRDYKCGVCDAGVDINDNICGKCGAIFNGKCQKCGSNIESGWVVCPNCNYMITEKISKKIPVIRKKNNGFIIAIIGIIGVTLMYVFLPYRFFSDEYVENWVEMEVMRNITVEDIRKSKVLSEWVDTFEEEKVYIIYNTNIAYIYINNNAEYLNVSAQADSYGKISVYFEPVENSNSMGYDVFMLDEDNIENVYIEDKKVDFVETFTEENIDISSWKEK